MVDDVLLDKVAIIERRPSRIHEEYLGHESKLTTDHTRQDSIVINLQRACEAAIDLAMHAVRKRRLGLAQDVRDSFTLLEKDGFVRPEVAAHIRAMVGFRNSAVHQYLDLSMPVLRAILDNRLENFTQFTGKLIGGQLMQE